jgi:hypothetical protein
MSCTDELNATRKLREGEREKKKEREREKEREKEKERKRENGQNGDRVIDICIWHC